MTLLTTLKIVSLFALLISGFIGGVLPIRFRDVNPSYLSYGNCLAAGVFFGAGFLHLLPDSTVAFQSYSKALNGYPMSYLLCCIGFSVVLVIEEAALSFQEQQRKLFLAEANSRANEQESAPTSELAYSSGSLRLKYKSVDETFQVADSVARGMAPRSGMIMLSSNGSGLSNTASQSLLAAAAAAAAPDSSYYVSMRSMSTGAPVTSEAGRQQLLELRGSWRGGQQGHSSSSSGRAGADAEGGDGGGGDCAGAAQAHDHAGAHFDVLAAKSAIVPYILVGALSIHAIFGGLALGTVLTVTSWVFLFITIIAHMPLMAFALGVSVVDAKGSTRQLLGLVAILTVMCPLGIGIGIIISAAFAGSPTLVLLTGIFKGLASGTFLFVAFFEVIPKELANAPKVPKLLWMFGGFAFMAGLKAFAENTPA